MKRCRSCNIVKDLGEFHKDRTTSDGLKLRCKECISVEGRKKREMSDSYQSRKTGNKILEDHGDWLLVDISTPKHSDATMAIDRDVFESHKGGRIFASKQKSVSYIYARYNLCKSIKYLHRDVIECDEVDHITHGTMEFVDNRRSNLRSVTRSQNNLNAGIRSDNTSGKTGVTWSKQKGKWHSRIYIDGKVSNLGYYSDKKLAISARLEAEALIKHYLPS